LIIVQPMHLLTRHRKDIIRKRVQLLVRARLKDQDKVTSAIKTQDKIRKKKHGKA